MKVSICVPIYNVGNYLSDCLDSLFQQSYQNIEYIFVDDASTDNSINILRKKIKEYQDFRKDIKIITHNINRGLAAARNTAIEHTSGEFVFWVDPDDTIKLDAIEQLIKWQQETKSEIIFYRMCHQYKTYSKETPSFKETTKKNIIKGLLCRKLPVGVCGKLIKTSLYKKYNITVEEGINMGEDFQTIPRLVYFSQKTTFYNEVLYYYNRTNSNSYTNIYSIKKSEQVWRSIKILEDFFSNKDPDYNYYLQVSKLKQIAWDTIGYAKYKENLSYLINKRRLIKEIDRKLWNMIEKTYYPILLFNNIRIVVLYAKIASKMKRLFNNLKIPRKSDSHL